MPATPFTLQSCHRTKQDGTRQDGWQVVKIVAGQTDPEPLHEPWFGVFSKQLAGAFLDGVLLLWFIQQRKTEPAVPPPQPPPVPDKTEPDPPRRRHLAKELQFT